MPKAPFQDQHLPPAEPGLRIILRRLREIIEEPGDGQSRLDKIVRQIAGLMVAEVCSIYLKRQDGSLELFATEGLNPTAVHRTFMNRGEGLVGRCAEMAVPVNEPDAQSHPAFSYRPETGEEIYHSFLAVPILRSGDVLGVLTVQNKTPREYADEDVEILHTTAMVLAEQLVSAGIPGANMALEFSRRIGHVVKGQAISEGIALGHAVLHEPRVVVTRLTADDPAAEALRLDTAVTELKAVVDEMIGHGDLAREGEHKDILEAYRMFANDRGWQRRLKEAIQSGLSAEAAVERVQNQTRARMLRQRDPYWRDRVRDLEDLSDRLLRILTTPNAGGSVGKQLPRDAIVIARTMGAADLLDYDRTRLRGIVIEEAGGQSHVAIVARALGIVAVTDVRRLIERIDVGDPIIVDGTTGEVFVRPTSDVIQAFSDKVRFRARQQRQYRSLIGRPALTVDGERISLQMNAGLPDDLVQLEQSGAEGIGLFRTELQFMVAATFPRLDRQTQVYRSVIEGAAGKPIVFRTLDIGGDKVLPYMRQHPEDNPALGWRGIRMGLDRTALLRTQLRALLRAAEGAELRVMIPMVSEPSEIIAARTILAREVELNQRRGTAGPSHVHFGIMIEVPSLLFDLEAVLPLVDFASVGSNDLLQYFFASDRANPKVSGRFDVLSPSFLRALSRVTAAGRRLGVPIALCGEIGGRPLEAMALIGAGFRTLSMAPASIGPVKTMVLGLHAKRAEAAVARLIARGGSSIREGLAAFAAEEGIEV
ncbi:MAG: phosphoenolpyruvate--protein phosphotransferase [Hyphomicrobiaceae bacterium]